MKHRAERKYQDPIECPICGKVFGEWEEVEGVVVIKKWCPLCKKMVYIGRATKKLDIDGRKGLD